jgi:alpha-L-fucosidase
LLEDHQPNAVLFGGPFEQKNLIRWVGNEDGIAPYPHWSTASLTISEDGKKELSDYHGDPDGEIWYPGEADFANRKKSAWHSGWLWRANQEEHLYSVDELVDRYYTSVGRNANMMIGMGIDTSGLFPEEDSKRFAGFGERINAMFGSPVAETQGEGTRFLLKIEGGPKTVNHVIIMEDITRGERIRKYTVEAFVDNRWTRVCEGISVGHKRIQRFDSVEANKVRLSVDSSVASPVIRKLAVYNVN